MLILRMKAVFRGAHKLRILALVITTAVKRTGAKKWMQ